MAETVTFTARLVDQISGTAARVKASLGSIGDAVRKQNAAVNQAMSAQRGIGSWLGPLQANTSLGAFARLRAGLSGMAQSVKLLASAQDDATRGTAGRSFAESFDTARTALGQMRGAVSAVAGPFLSVIGVVADFGLALVKWCAIGLGALAALAATGAAYLAKLTFELYSLRQTATLALGALSGGQGEATFEQVLVTARRLGMTVQEATANVQGLMAAGFKGDAAFSWVSRVADLSAIGITGEKVKRLVLAMGQIKAAGVLQGDELRQLQELGIDLGPVWQGIADQMGISAEAAKKLKGTGKITADVALGGLERAIAKLTGAATPGAAREKYLTSTLLGAWDRVKSAGSLALLSVADKAKSAFESLRPVLDSVAAWFSSPEAETWGKRLAGIVSVVVNVGKSGFAALTALVKGFSSALGPALDTAGKDPLAWLRDPVALAQLEKIGKALGEAAVGIGKLAATALGWTERVSGWIAAHPRLIDQLARLATAFAYAAVAIVLVGAGLAAVALSPVIAFFGMLAVAIDTVRMAVDALGAAWTRVSQFFGGGAIGAGVTGGIAGGIASGIGGVFGLGVPGFAEGGPVAETGMAQVHAGEFVVPRGGALVATGGGGGTSVTVAPGAIVVYQQPGESGAALASRLITELQRVAWSHG